MTFNKIQLRDKNILATPSLQALLFVAMLVLPAIALAGPAGGEATGRVTEFFTDVGSLLNAASIAVVTIAVIFAGYQIAFAHKRISDVAPILIGGFLIGAAGQVAGMLIDEDTSFGAQLIQAALSTYA